MPPFKTYGEKPVVLLTNDDGPPSASSPNIFTFYQTLQAKLGWIVKVVIPDCQKSWVGKAFAISDVITASYFYPLGPDGLTGDITNQSRPLKEGETMEWILLTGTPATCTNIALHNLYPGQIDLVISGPNHGRNSSTAFSLSSGTLGAALAGALSTPVPGPSSGPSLHTDHLPCIAVSYGVVTRPVTAEITAAAHDIAADVCKQLWDDWGFEDEEIPGGERRPVQVYSVNVPLVAEALRPENRRVCWTTMWRNSYGQLFKTTKLDPNLNWWAHGPKPNQPTLLQPQNFVTALKTSLQSVKEEEELQIHSQLPRLDHPSQEKKSDIKSSLTILLSAKSTYDPSDNTKQPQSGESATKVNKPTISTTSTAGPGALPTPNVTSPSSPAPDDDRLKFHFAPNIKPLLFPPIEDLPKGTDAWAFAKGYVSVTPMKAMFSGMSEGVGGFGRDVGSGKDLIGTVWKSSL